MAERTRILIVDDHPMVRDVVRVVLASAGYQPVCAEDGPAALALYDSSAIDGAIIDVDMPRMWGIEVCERLHAAAFARHRDLVAWMMTGLIRPGLSGAAQRAGALGILAKPFSRVELLDCFSALPVLRLADAVVT